MNLEAWNFGVWKRFNNKIYKEAITAEDIIGNGIHEFHETLNYVEDGVVVEDRIVQPESYRECIRIDKGKKRYLLPVAYENNMPLKATESFPCLINKSDKKQWHFITRPTIMNIKGELAPGRTLKNFMMDWNPQKHTHPDQWLLMKAIMLASKYKAIKICVCSEPSMGKNANFTLLNHITRDALRIQKPTLARMETICYYNHVVLPDEITSMTSAQVGEIEPMILAVGDNSTEYAKHSLAQNKDLNEVDLTRLSIVFTYNRVKDVGAKDSFFDDKWKNKAAFRSRYPQLLLSGEVLGDNPIYNNNEAEKIMENNFDAMRTTAKELIYWIENLHEHQHDWNREALTLSPRHKTNMQGLLEVIDAMCDSQLEYDVWLGKIKTCMTDYDKMLSTGQGDLMSNTPQEMKLRDDTR
jgi:hypothetical protein